MDSIVLESERVLGVGAAEARMVVVRALRDQQFTMTSEQVSIVIAKRGSQVVGSVQPKKLPVVVRATFQPTGAGCTVSIRISDAWRSPMAGKVWGMNGPYRTLMADIQMGLDHVLVPIAGADITFTEGTVITATRDVAGLSVGNAALGKAGGVIADKTDALLTPASNHATVKALKEVVLRGPNGNASFDRMDVEAMFTVGLLVSNNHGSMPANLAHDVELLATRLETAVAQQPSGRVVIDIDEAEVPVAEFLGLQAAIRQELPLRTLHVCTTCKFEKVVNPDYEKLQEKNRRRKALTGAVGATVSSSGINPFVLVGSFVRLKNFDIPFVCPRCQGLDADSSVITYCPNCGQRRDEAVLRRCGRCQYNFGTRPPGVNAEFWRTEAPAPEAPTSIPTFVATTVAEQIVPRPAPSPDPRRLPEPQLLSAPPTFPVPTAPAAAPAMAPAPAAAASTPPGWHSDPTRRHQHRYWDGWQWTPNVADNGTPGTDPV